METISPIQPQPDSLNPLIHGGLASTPFSQEMVTLSKQDYIDLIQKINYFQARHIFLSKSEGLQNGISSIPFGKPTNLDRKIRRDCR